MIECYVFVVLVLFLVTVSLPLYPLLRTFIGPFLDHILAIM